TLGGFNSTVTACRESPMLQQLLDRLALIQEINRPAVVVRQGRRRIDAENFPVEGGQHILWDVPPIGWTLRLGRGRADDLPHLEPAAGDQGEAGLRPVVSAGIGVDLRRPAVL